MRTLLLFATIVFVVPTSVAADAVSVPWEEFKTLLVQSIERRIEASRPEPPQRHTIDEADYQLTIGPQGARGRARIAGRVLTGGPAPIGLFGREIIVSDAGHVSGGALITSPSDIRRILFLPDGTSQAFQIDVSFMLVPREDQRSKIVSLAIPSALRNSLQVSLAPGAQLLEAPGLADGSGVYHFSLEESLTLRYLEKGEVAVALPMEIDAFSRIQPQGKRLIVTSHFAPAHPASQPLMLQLGGGAQFVAASLGPSRISKHDFDRYEIRLPDDDASIFWIQFAVEESAGGGFALQLPAIQENRGREGNFVVEEPDDGRITVSGAGLATGIPIGRLGSNLLPFAGKVTAFMRIASGETIQLGVTRFAAVSAPAIVLASQYFFTSFEENGSILSVLVMDVPPDAGPRLSVKPVAGAQVWSLDVNGQDRKVYSDEAGAWIVPLDEGVLSHVELAMLRQGEKLGLHGRLETALPETGLAARSLCVGIALPERVQLLSLEGPVSPAAGAQWQLPPDFIGKPYLFSRSFHKGEGMTLAVSYKEPVKP